MAKAKVSAKKLKEIEAAEQKFRPLDTPASPYPFPNLGMEKPASKKKTTKAKPKAAVQEVQRKQRHRQHPRPGSSSCWHRSRATPQP